MAASWWFTWRTTVIDHKSGYESGRKPDRNWGFHGLCRTAINHRTATRVGRVCAVELSRHWATQLNCGCDGYRQCLPGCTHSRCNLHTGATYNSPASAPEVPSILLLATGIVAVAIFSKFRNKGCGAYNVRGKRSPQTGGADASTFDNLASQEFQVSAQLDSVQALRAATS